MNSRLGRPEGARSEEDYNAFLQEPPDWVRRAVRDEIEAIYESLIEEERCSQQRHEAEPGFWPHSDEDFVRRRLLLKRLASDPRMRRVWGEIYKEHRDSRQPAEKFWYPAQPETLRQIRRNFPSSPDPSELQDFAARCFFEEAFSWAGCPLPFLSKKDVTNASEPYLEVAETLRCQASKLASLGFGQPSLVVDLQTIATACERTAARIKNPPYLIPVASRPDQGDKATRAYVLCMTAFCRIAFGRSLYGTVARTTNVALCVDLTQQEVREMVRKS
jgi:hypothetical protein